MPEHRGGTGSPVFLILVLLAVLIIGGVIIYILLGNDSAAAPAASNSPASAQALQLTQPRTGLEGNPVSQLPFRQPTPAPVSPQDTNPNSSATNSGFLPPEVDYGEVVTEGFVDLVSVAGDIRTWYTLHLDSSTRLATFFFAFYDPASGSISRTVVVRDYSQSELIDNAEVTIFYPDHPERVINFERETGKIISKQYYSAQPYEPSILSREMRISLIYHGLALGNESGNIQAELQVDLTGIIADREGMAVMQIDQAIADNALSEIQEVIDQIESRRSRS